MNGSYISEQSGNTLYGKRKDHSRVKKPIPMPIRCFCVFRRERVVVFVVVSIGDGHVLSRADRCCVFLFQALARTHILYMHAIPGAYPDVIKWMGLG